MKSKTVLPGKNQAGFSMVEFLMVALIMAVGLLGVASMQLISIKASSGSSNLTTAAQIADRIMDQVEEEARLTWLSKTASSVVTTTAPPNLFYLANTTLPFTLDAQLFDLSGTPLPTTATTGPFSAVVKAAAVTSSGATIGGMMDVTVTVTFQVEGQGSNTVPRSLVLTRRITHA